MMPQGSNYPSQFDDEKNLLIAHDSLQVTLKRDHYIGENFVLVDGDTNKFPENGIITLTDQCSDPNDRSVSFYYGKKNKEGFFELELLPESRDVFKSKKLTTVSQQVMAEYHEIIKNSIIAIEEFMGTRNTIDTQPNGSTIFGRINFLRNLLYAPKAWFEADKVLGLAPLTIKFKSVSSGKDIICDWNFGDGTEDQTINPEIIKIYTEPGIYDVSLTVSNAFGSDNVIFQKMIQVKAEAPEEAFIEFTPSENQILDAQQKLRTSINEIINLEVPQGISPKNATKRYSGEAVNDEQQPLNAITKYTWNLSDDLPHDNLPKTVASYSIGGLYDAILRVDTKFGTYRTTIMPKSIDVIEFINLWLWTKTDSAYSAHEFGLICETFKSNYNIPLIINRNNDSLISDRSKKEFQFNNGFAPKNNSSGHKGNVLLFWASDENKIEFVEYNAFLDTYNFSINPMTRPWNWVSLISPTTIYFILGTTEGLPPPTTSPTNQTKTCFSIGDGFTKNEPLTYLNGAHELGKNAVTYDKYGEPTEGHFSIYRTAWKDQSGYLLRSSDQGNLSNFYKTEGTLGYPFINLTKLVDMPHLNNKDGQMVSLSEGIYFFGSTGTVAAFKDTTGTWEVGPQANINNEFILATSDGDKRAYLTTKDKLIKFNEVDLTFTTIASIPGTEQWLIGVY
jgi:PKD repeat protein